MAFGTIVWILATASSVGHLAYRKRQSKNTRVHGAATEVDLRAGCGKKTRRQWNDRRIADDRLRGLAAEEQHTQLQEEGSRRPAPNAQERPWAGQSWKAQARVSEAEEAQQRKERARLANLIEHQRILQTRLRTATGLQDLTPHQFEDRVADRFRLDGYIVRQTPYTGDGGVDMYIWRDTHRWCVQCKRYSRSVGIAAMREFASVCADNQSRGIFVTTSEFTAGAAEYAKAIGLSA